MPCSRPDGGPSGPGPGGVPALSWTGPGAFRRRATGGRGARAQGNAPAAGRPGRDQRINWMAWWRFWISSSWNSPPASPSRVQATGSWNWNRAREVW